MRETKRKKEVAINEEQSSLIYKMKAWSILSVVCAHTSSYMGKYDLGILQECLLSLLGTIGVPIFFFLSGLLFKTEKHKTWDIIKKKLWNLFLPWFFTGTAVWLYVVLRKGGVSLSAWFHFLIGNGSYLYYMSMLTVCYLLFAGKKFRPLRAYVIGGISLAWIVLESLEIVPTSHYYMNPLNWMIYFSLGILVRQYDLFAAILRIAKRYRYYIISAWVLMVLGILYAREMIYYWHPYYLLVELLSFVMVICISYGQRERHLISEVGKQSFAIYLLHMPIAGIVNTFFIWLNIELVLFIKPLAVIAITMVGIKFLQFIEYKIHGKWKFIHYFGIR